MKRIVIGILFLLLSMTAVQARDISGQWQGTLHFTFGDLKFILKVKSAADESYRGVAYSPDQGPVGDPVDAITLEGARFRFAINQWNVTFDGTLDTDGNSISGQFTQGKTIPLVLQRATRQTAWAIDPSPHKVLFVQVDKGVKLEVIDWGGTGKPLMFLAGLGATGHAFDKFAPKFTADHHVYAITRRGFGASSAPNATYANYSASRLGDDVIAVIDALKLDRPALVGHSIAGEELGVVATRNPEKVSGLIYLDAAYAYAYCGPGSAIPLAICITAEMRQLQKYLIPFRVPPGPSRADIQTIQAHLSELEKDIAAAQVSLRDMASVSGPAQAETSQSKINLAIMEGVERFTAIPVPTLALVATNPKIPDNATPEQRTGIVAHGAEQARQADLFEKGVPSARVVRIAGASHAIWLSNEAEVTREMNAFLASLH